MADKPSPHQREVEALEEIARQLQRIAIELRALRETLQRKDRPVVPFKPRRSAS